MRIKTAIPVLALVTAPVWAADAPGMATSGYLLEGFFGLLIVLGLMAAAFWLLKRMQSSRLMPGVSMKVVGGIAIGGRERIMVVEIAGQWLIIGVTPTQINLLTTMPRQEMNDDPLMNANSLPFAEYLKKTFAKKNDA